MSQKNLGSERQLPTSRNQASSPDNTLESNGPSHPWTGRSDLCFASIESVHDGGIALHSAWEHNLAQPSPSEDLAATQKLRQLLGNKPITSDTLSEALVGHAVSACGTAADEYLPLDKLKILISSVSVRELLKSLNLSPSTVDTVIQGMFNHDLHSENQYRSQKTEHQELSSFSRIFAMLVITKHAKEIEKFIKYGVNDFVLPLVKATKKGTQDSGASVHIHSMGTLKTDNRKLSACFSAFNKTDLMYFFNVQKMVNVPFFSFPGDDSTVFFYDLHPSCVLPITSVGAPKHGGNGSVKRIVLHAAHHNYRGARTGSLNNEFAVKTLHIHNEERFKKEVEASEKLSPKKLRSSPDHLDHLDHLVHLELAYRHGNECCLVFPWARGNLKEYWTHGKKSLKEHKDVVWFFKQCWGLAFGLRRLHDRRSDKIAPKATNDIHSADDLLAEAHSTDYGRHGDLKPENILWFPDYRGEQDYLAICDFGSTEFNSLHSKSHVDADAIYGYTTTYQPPDSLVQPEVGQTYDVWSLGCVFLEFVSWFLLGNRAIVEDFPSARMMALEDFGNGIVREDRFFHIESSRHGKTRKSAMVKPAVTSWIERIHKDNSCPEAIHKFLDLIQSDMLVPNPPDRADCKSVRDKLKEIYNNCRGDSIYATEAFEYKPQKPISKGADILPSLWSFSTVRSQSKFESKSLEKVIQGPSLVETRQGQEPRNYFNNNTGHIEFALERYRTQLGERRIPDLPIHSTNETTGSPNGLSQVPTTDTTPLTTQPGDVALDSQDSPAKHQQRGARSDSPVKPLIDYHQAPGKPRSNNAAEQVEAPDSRAGASTLREEEVSKIPCEPSQNPVLVQPDPTGHRVWDLRGRLHRAVDKLRGPGNNSGRLKAFLSRRSKKSS